jgi:hypothetical protein
MLFNATNNATNHIVQSLKIGGLTTGPNSLARLINNEQMMIPDTNCNIMRTGFYSDNWTFTFILEKNDHYGTLNKVVPQKFIISGYFTEEPFVPSSLETTRPIPNPNSRMIYLTATVITQQLETTPNGIGTRTVERVMANVDIPRVLNNFIQSHDTLYRCDIASCAGIGAVTSPEVNDMFANPNNAWGGGLSIGMGGSTYDIGAAEVGAAEVVSLDTNDPYDNIKNLVGTAVTYLNDNMYIGNSFSTMQNIQNDLSMLHQQNPLANYQLFADMSEPTVDTIMRSFNPNVISINASLAPSYARDGSSISPSNIYSSMAAQLIPKYLMEYGLGGMVFSYDSYSDNFQIISCDWLTPIDEFMQRSKLDGFKIRFMSELRQLMLVPGDFCINVSVNMSHQIVIDLNYRDYSSVDGYFVQEALFKGYAGMSFGNSDTVINNASNLTGFLANISANSAIL